MPASQPASQPASWASRSVRSKSMLCRPPLQFRLACKLIRPVSAVRWAGSAEHDCHIPSHLCRSHSHLPRHSISQWAGRQGRAALNTKQLGQASSALQQAKSCPSPTPTLARAAIARWPPTNKWTALRPLAWGRCHWSVASMWLCSPVGRVPPVLHHRSGHLHCGHRTGLDLGL